MRKTIQHEPRIFPPVMVSSTFTDLVEHRAALINAIHQHKLHANVMENDSARLVDVIDSSLQMVRDSAAYIGVISLKYGQTPECPKRNPGKLSITELEFNEAQDLGHPILLFIMGEEHPGKKTDFEKDAEKEQKLNAFRDRAKQHTPGSKVNRVYATFNSLQEFKERLGSSLAELSKHLASPKGGNEPEPGDGATPGPIPTPPAFYAAPDYIGRHTFIGRKAQLETLSEWAQPSDPTSVLLFEAIGGNGKSMLTWEWTTKYATAARADWAGRFWYSFYEKGAVMRAFCQHALAYMTQHPLEAFEKKTTAEMRVELVALLRRQPWLLILDGLERVLVAYHRIDAAEVPDEEVNRPTDKVLDRNPCDATRDEDTDLLRALAAAAPSKILITSRLTPRALLNQAGIPLPGVKPLSLPGLDEADAEELLRSCGIQGTSADIRYYLTNYCGNHPLVIGVLAGLINSPGPHRGNFDSWAADPEYGAKLDLASLDLIQSRNHILRAAMEALGPHSRQLLSTLALLSNAVDYETVAAFNPHLPPEPKEVENPEPPEQHWLWHRRTDEQKGELRQQFEAALAERKAYEHAMQLWRDSEAVREAPKKLGGTIQDLEHRGLLQYDPRTRRYDLHPVVRGVAAGGMKAEDKEGYGQRVVDHYSSQPHNPYEQATTMEDVENGLNVVRTWLKLGRYQQAADAYIGDLADALSFNLEAYVVELSLLRHFFPVAWDQLPKDVDASDGAYLANAAGGSLFSCGKEQTAIGAFVIALRVDMEMENWNRITIYLPNLSQGLARQSLSKALRICRLALDLATAVEDDQAVFKCCLYLFAYQSRTGQWNEAEATWRLLDPMGREWSRSMYRQGDAEYEFAEFRLGQGTLREDHLNAAATLAEKHFNRHTVRGLHSLRGSWWLEQGEWALAVTSFDQALSMVRERRLVDEFSETGLALAKFHLHLLTGSDARSEAERLARLRHTAHRYLGLFWQAIGDLEQAKHHALAAYKRAWADGEPYVHRYELTKATALLNELGVPVPNLPPYDPAKDEPFPWEAEVRAAIEKLRAEKEGQEEKPD